MGKQQWCVYPNPTVSEFENTIKFDVTETSVVKIEIINDKGEVLKTLANGMHSSGKYQYPFTVKDLQSEINILYYRLTIDGNIQTKRIAIQN